MSRTTDHPGPEELLALQLGALPEDERDRVEEHLSLCPECAQVVLDLEGFPDLDDAEPEIPPEVGRKLEDQKRRLLELAREPETPPGDYLEPRDPGFGTAAGSGSGPGGWLGSAPMAWAVAAALLVATVGMGVWSVDQRRGVDHVQVYSVAVTSPRGGEEEAAKRIPLDGREVTIALAVAESHPSYRVDLIDFTGETVASGDDLRLTFGTQYISYSLPLPLPPGVYRLEVYGLETDPPVYLGREIIELIPPSSLEPRRDE